MILTDFEPKLRKPLKNVLDTWHEVKPVHPIRLKPVSRDVLSFKAYSLYF